MLDRLAFVIGEAIQAIRRNGTMTVAAITTAAVALFLMGGLAYGYMGLVRYGEGLTGKFEMEVFLKEGADKATVKAVAKKIRAVPGVQAAFWIPKEKRWEKQRQEKPGFYDEEIENPNPESFKVILADLSQGEAVAEAVRDMPEVDPAGVNYLGQEMKLIEDLKGLLRWVGYGLGGLLLLTSGLLIYNAIRLAVLSRRAEIRIMQLVGASRFTVRFPFIVEGVVQGALGGLLAAALMLSCHHALKWKLADYPLFSSLPPFPFLPTALVLTGAGALYGFFCSSYAVSRTAKRL